MRILHVNDAVAELGGTEVYIYNLLNLLRENGHQVDLFGKVWIGDLYSMLTRYYDPATYFKFLDRIRLFKPDVVHCHNISKALSPSVLHAAKRSKIPIAMTIHDFHLICLKKIPILEDGKPCRGIHSKCITSNCFSMERGRLNVPYRLAKFMKISLHRRVIRNNVDAFISPSKTLYYWIKESLRIDNVRVIPNFIDLSGIRCEPLRDTKEILFIGRLSKEKGVDVLVKAMAKVVKQMSEARLTIAGTGPEEEKLRSLVRKLGLNNYIKFYGWMKRESLERLFGRAELVCVPSTIMESFGLVALESMAHGRPILVSDVGGLEELVEDGNVGYSFNVGDVVNLENRILSMLQNFPGLKRMSIEARRRVKKCYSPERHYEELMKLYGELSHP